MIFFAKGIYSQLIFNDLLNTTRDAELLLQSENFLNSIASPSKRSSFGKFVLQFNSFPINSIMREIIYNTHIRYEWEGFYELDCAIKNAIKNLFCLVLISILVLYKVHCFYPHMFVV